MGMTRRGGARIDERSASGGAGAKVLRRIAVVPWISPLILVSFLAVTPIMLMGEPADPAPARAERGARSSPLWLSVEADLSVSIDDGAAFPSRELPAQLRAKLPRTQAVFVDPAEGVPWRAVLATVDIVRGIGDEVDRDLPIVLAPRDRELAAR